MGDLSQFLSVDVREDIRLLYSLWYDRGLNLCWHASHIAIRSFMTVIL